MFFVDFSYFVSLCSSHINIFIWSFAFSALLLVFWLFWKVRVTWLIKIQVKIIIFRVCIFIFSAHFVSDIGFEWRPRTPFIITFFSTGPAFAWNLFYISINFQGVIFIFFISLHILGFCTELYVFIYSRRKSFWLKLCPTLKVFLMIDACAHKEQAN